MAKLLDVGKAVYVRLSGRLGHVLGLSENPAHAGSDEPVYRVKLDDDGTLVYSGHSSLGEPKEADKAAAELQESVAVSEDQAPAEGAPEA